MSDSVGDVFLTFSIEEVAESVEKAKAEVRKAKFEGVLSADVKKFLAEVAAAKKAAERDKVKIGFDNSALTQAMRNGLKSQVDQGVARRQQESASAALVQKLLVQGTLDRIKAEKAVADVRRKAEFQAYRENDARSRAAERAALKAIRLQNKEMARVLGSGQRPQRGALARSSAAFADRSAEVVQKYSLDLSPAEKEAQAFRARLLALRLKFKPGMDTAKVNAQIAQLDLELARFQDRRDIPVELVAETRVAREQLKEAIDQARADTIRPLRLRVISEENTTKIKAKLDELRLKFAEPIEANVFIRDNIDKVQRKLAELRAQTALGSGGMGRFQKILSAVLLAAGPAAIALGGVATAIGAIGSAAIKAVGSLGVLPGLIATAAGAFAALKVGFSGVSDALSAYTKNTEASAKATVKSLSQINAVRNAMEAVQDATRDIADQQRQGQDTINGLLDQRIDLQNKLRDSELSIRSAEAQRTKSLTDLKRALRDVALANDEAASSTRDAELALSNAQIGGDPEEIRRARLELEKARRAQSDTAEDGNTTRGTAQLVADQANAEARAAYEAQADLNKQLVALDKDLNTARTENARQQELAQRRLRDAQEGLIDAQNEAKDGTKAQTSATNELAAALAKLSPNAREFVSTVNELRTAWQGVRTATQEALFAGAAGGFRTLTSVYVPLLTTALAGIATALNGIGGEFNGFVTSAEGTKLISSILEGVRATLEALQPAIEPFLHALLTILDVSAGQLPGLVGQFTTLLTSFDAFVSRAATDGSFARFISDGVSNLSGLLQLIYQLGDALSSILSAMDQGGGLGAMIGGLKDFNAAIGEGGAARAGLVSFFQDLSAATETAFSPQFAANVGDIFSAFGDNLVTIAPHLRDFLDAFTGFIAKITSSGSLASILDGLLDGAVAFFGAFTPEVVSSLAQTAGAIGQLAAQLGGVLGAALAAILPQLEPVITALLHLVSDALGGITGFISAHPDLFGTIVTSVILLLGFVTRVLPILLKVGGVLLRLGSFILPLLTGEGGFGGLIAILTPVIAALSEIIVPVLAVIAVIAALAFAIYEIIHNWDAILDFFKDLPGKLASAAGDLWGWITDGLSAALDAVLGWGSSVLDFFASLGSTIASAASDLWSGAVSGLGAAYDAVLAFGANVIQFFVDLPGNLVELAGNIFQWIGDKLLEAVLGVIVIGARLAVWVSTLPAQLAQLGTELFTWIIVNAVAARDGALALLEGIATFITTLPGRLLELGLSLFTWIVSTAVQAKDAAIGVMFSLIGFVAALPGRLQEAGANAFTWLVAKGVELRDAIFVKISEIVAFFTELPDRLALAGANVFAWLIRQGLDLRDQIGLRIGEIIGFVANLPNRIRNAAVTAFDGLKDGFKNVINSIIRMWNGLQLKLTVPEDKFSKALGISGLGVTLGTPDIPYLAKGGITSGPTLAMIGDNASGRERVTPLDADGLSNGERAILNAVSTARGGDTIVIGDGVLDMVSILSAVAERVHDDAGGANGMLDRLKASGALSVADRKAQRSGSTGAVFGSATRAAFAF